MRAKSILQKGFIFEGLFALFLLSYQIKNAALFQSWPDVTLVLFGGVCAGLVMQYIKKRHSGPPHDSGSFFFSPGTLASLSFLILVWLSLLWREAPPLPYATSKRLLLTLYTVPAYLISEHVLAPCPLRLERLYGAFFGISVLVGGEIIRLLLTTSSPPLNDIFGNNYLVAGQTLGLGLVVLFAHALKTLKGSSALLSVLCAALFLALLLILPGRGPVLSSLFSCGILTGICLITSSSLPRSLSIFASMIGGALLLYAGLTYAEIPLYETSLIRAEALLQDTLQDRSLLDRFDFYRSSGSLFLEHPFLGVGFGRWSVASGIKDLWAPHPHNLVLEVASELGLLGLAFLGCWGMLLIKQFKKNFHPPLPRSLLMSLGILCFTLFNALKSGDLNDNIVLWSTMGVVLGVVKRNFKQEHS